MKRAFWIALGLGAGVTATILASRWAKRQRARLAPSSIGPQAQELARDVLHVLREAVEEGARAMREREEEIRAAIPD
ncbi:MAG: hypothetical protein ACRDH6_06540 [Actinomycetota bacterium]